MLRENPLQSALVLLRPSKRLISIARLYDEGEQLDEDAAAEVPGIQHGREISAVSLVSTMNDSPTGMAASGGHNRRRSDAGFSFASSTTMAAQIEEGLGAPVLPPVFRTHGGDTKLKPTQFLAPPRLPKEEVFSDSDSPDDEEGDPVDKVAFAHRLERKEFAGKLAIDEDPSLVLPKSFISSGQWHGLHWHAANGNVGAIKDSIEGSQSPPAARQEGDDSVHEGLAE